MIKSRQFHNLVRKKLLNIHPNVRIYNSIPTLTFTCSYSAKVNETKIDISHLEGVSYLNERLIKLQGMENPTYLVLKEIKEINQKLGKVEINNCELMHNFSVVNDKLSILQSNDEKIMNRINEIDTTKKFSKSDDKERIDQSTPIPFHYNENEWKKNDRILFADGVYTGLKWILGSACLLWIVGPGILWPTREQRERWRQEELQKQRLELQKQQQKQQLELQKQQLELQKRKLQELIDKKDAINITALLKNNSSLCIDYKLQASLIDIAVRNQNSFLLEKADNSEIKVALIKFVKAKDLKSISYILKNGGKIHERGYDCWSTAIIEGDISVVRHLINLGADVKADKNYGIIISAKNGRQEIVELLLSKGAIVNAQNNKPLRSAAKKGYAKVVELLCENGADPTAENDKAIFNAASRGMDASIQNLDKSL